ncbi:vitamin K epoxide reductase family protein [Candidatus Dormiibacter inghamiae]|uniref:vitamin K epoxide reductase family protein n=1 Tax=Candidatus Dormiibacter inghamiae TaxID=3127013 RepID=UPI0030C6D887
MIAAYLTYSHYEQVPLACTQGQVANCAAVTHSSYSTLPGSEVPISVPGLLFFAGVTVWAVLALSRVFEKSAWAERALLFWSMAGLLFVLYLVFVEIVRLQRICEWCTAAHVLTLVIFLLALNRVGRPTAA